MTLANPANLGASGRADTTLRAIERGYEQATGTQLDGVVLIDSVAISRLGEEVGPLEATRRSGVIDLPPDEILDYLLHDQYDVITDFEDLSTNPDRREATAELVSTIGERILTDEVALADLIDGLRDIRDGRHLLISTDEGQSAWEALGVSATLSPAETVIGVVNAGASKLDQYIDTAIAVVTSSQEDAASATITVTASNRSPVDDLPYVVGVQPEGTPDGSAATMFTFTLPSGATVLETVSPTGSVVVADGYEGSRPVVGVRVDVSRGESAEVSVRFTLDPAVGFSVVPTARRPPTTWWIDGAVVDVDGRGSVTVVHPGG